jgi:dipeptidyl aminopeptidase/acylaminoacyl peptidase
MLGIIRLRKRKVRAVEISRTQSQQNENFTLIREILKWSAALALVWFCTFEQMALAGPPPVETFFQDSLMTGAKLSPNGKSVALRMRTKDSRMQLAILDLQTMKVNAAAAITESDVDDFRWVNDHRLIFNLTDRRVGVGDFDAGPGLYAVNADGSGFRPLVERVRHFVTDGQSLKLLPWNTYLLDSIGNENTDAVYAAQVDWVEDKAIESQSLIRINTLKGQTTEFDTPKRAFRWLFDSKGELRIVVTREVNQISVLYREPASGSWTKLAEYEMLSPDAIVPAYLDPSGQLYVTARNGADAVDIYRFDIAKRKLEDKPFIHSSRYDLENPEFIESGGKLLGIRYTVDAEVTQWLEPEMEALQKAIDRALPGAVNHISVAKRPETKFVVVASYADNSPAVYYLFNTEQRKLMKLGSVNPDIDRKTAAQTEMVHYAARDGLEIPAYLTLPRGEAKKNLPMVVLVHGGPQARDGWGWNPEVQFLASRGYAVLQPQFRGSTGFGIKHFNAGLKQWGLAMQDDVADGTKWAVAQGIADPKRICIAGASYGGYAVLMGLVKDPDLYRCGIDWIGVTDINMMFTVKWSDASDIAKKYGMPRLIGDPVKDADQFKATSPLENAARIRAPLLLAYGGMDERVPIIHGKKFRDAVKPNNPNVEWVEYSQEGHGWRALETNVDFWTRVERFLDANIGKH